MQQDTTAQAPKNTHSSPRALDAQGRALQREGEGDRRGVAGLKTVRLSHFKRKRLFVYQCHMSRHAAVLLLSQNHHRGPRQELEEARNLRR